MKTLTLVRTVLCIFALAAFLYAYLEKHNTLTELRLEIPKITREKKRLEEDNARLEYELYAFKTPSHLATFLQNEPFSTLRQPIVDEIVILKAAPPPP